MEKQALFVYGTLMPGHCRWEFLAELLSDISYELRPAVLSGADMYDVSGFFPAVVQGTGVVRGVVVITDRFPDELIPTLDEIEGFSPQRLDSLYERKEVTVATTSGPVRAQTYFYAQDTDGLKKIENGRWEGK